MVEVEKEIAEEQNMKDNNALKRKALEDPSLLAASAPIEPSDKKIKIEEESIKMETESDSEGDEFFDASNEFTNVSIGSAAAPTTSEKPLGPIDTKYRKVRQTEQKRRRELDSYANFCVGETRLLISETKPILLLLPQSVICLSVEFVKNMVSILLVVRWH